MPGSAQTVKKKIVIIGGGLMGTSAALELARRGHRVTVLEKAIPGAEASSAAAGILGAEIENDTEGPMLDLCRLSRKLYPAWVRDIERDSQVPAGFLDGGSLKVFFDRKELNAVSTTRRWQQQAGTAKKLSLAGLRKLEPGLSRELSGGLYFDSDRRVTPAQLFRGVHIAARKAGAIFKTGAMVRHVSLADDGRGGQKATGVTMDDGSQITADAVVLAAGSWTGLVRGVPVEKRAVIPARGQLVELVSPEPMLNRLVFGAGVYLIPRADGRLLVGSTLEFVGFAKGVTAEGVRALLDGAIRLFPALGQAEFSRSWSNFRPYTSDHLPLLGSPGVEGLVIASGHYRNGILLAPATARIVAQLVEGKRAPLPLSPFDPCRPQPSVTNP